MGESKGTTHVLLSYFLATVKNPLGFRFHDRACVLGVVGVGAFVTRLFLVQMKVENGRFSIFGNRAIGVKFRIGAPR